MQREALTVPDGIEGEIRRPVAHDSAAKHVAGSATFIDDVVEPVGTLHVVPGAAAVAAGRIVSMDLTDVRSAPGVVLVLTARDVPGKNDVSPVTFDVDPCFADGIVEFHCAGSVRGRRTRPGGRQAGGQARPRRVRRAGAGRHRGPGSRARRHGDARLRVQAR